MNEYEVSGTRSTPNDIVEQSFAELIEAESSRDAYLTIMNKTGYTHVRVVAIKIKCPTCGGHHMTVDRNLYVY